MGEDESSVRYDGVQGVATQGLRPMRLGEDESSGRHEWGGGSREALEQRIAGQQGRWQRQGHGLWQELEQERVRERCRTNEHKSNGSITTPATVQRTTMMQANR